MFMYDELIFCLLRYDELILCLLRYDELILCLLRYDEVILCFRYDELDSSSSSGLDPVAKQKAVGKYLPV